jgi:hypothetical protein
MPARAGASRALPMKRAFLSLLCVALFSTGCAIEIGNRPPANAGATVGQQLVDLKKANEAGALSDGEYAEQKAKLIEPKYTR